MPYFALTYETGEGFSERRTPYRGEHLTLVRAAYERGELVMAGALGHPPSGALLIFRAPDRTTAENFAKSDPYVRQGVVASWHIEPWTVVVGFAPGEEPANLPK